jgi:hypothetical protein
LYSLVFHTVELLAFSNIVASPSAQLLAISISIFSQQMLHSTLLILFSDMPVAMFYWCQKLHSGLLALFAVMPIAISYLLEILDNLTLLAVLFAVMVCFLLLLSYMCRMVTNLFWKAVPASTSRATLLLSYMCRMVTNLFWKAVPASTRRATYTLGKLAARDYEELAWQILKSVILVYFNTLRFAFSRLAFAMVFAMACAMALAVALGRKKDIGFLFHICALLLRSMVLGWTAALSGKIALARAGEIALARKLFSN